ncbi:MAG: DUF1826 domain-containing protein [Verrucomicrobia bacterium]|nr:DUF1826 domain-containing protein [Verrucomicrobiota bacterium]
MKTQSPRSSTRLTSTSIVGGSRAVLRKARQSQFDLALWERSLPEPVAAFLDLLITDRDSVALDITAAPGRSLRASLAKHPLFSGAVRDDARHWVQEDFETLAIEFADILDCPKVRLRFNRIADDACAAFHVDTLPARLLCTYAGAGTQWADGQDVCRGELGLQGRTVTVANAAIVPNPDRIRTMPTGAVALFKGRLWPGGETRGLVHRSHPVCCDEHARLLLVIDPAGHAY